MKKFLRAILCLTLAMLFVMAPLETYASSRTVKIYKVNADYVRMHSNAANGTDNVVTKLRRGSKVFYISAASGRSRGWIKVRTEYGATGYIYKDYLSYYGAATRSHVGKATTSTKMRRRASSSSSRVTTLSRGQHVIAYSISGSWVYVKTLSGKSGYVKKSALRKAF